MIVDSHAHLVPPELIAAIRRERARFPGVRVIEEAGSLALAFAGALSRHGIVAAVGASVRNAASVR